MSTRQRLPTLVSSRWLMRSWVKLSFIRVSSDRFSSRDFSRSFCALDSCDAVSDRSFSISTSDLSLSYTHRQTQRNGDLNLCVLSTTQYTQQPSNRLFKEIVINHISGIWYFEILLRVGRLRCGLISERSFSIQFPPTIYLCPTHTKTNISLHEVFRHPSLEVNRSCLATCMF